MVAGGTVEVRASDVVSIEPEETFTRNPPGAPHVTGAYANLIRSAAAKHGLDEALIERVIAEESNFNPRAVSRKDALGLMQLLPKTATRYAVANVFDPAQNIDAGAHYLRDLLKQYQGNLPLALAAYNAGPEMVERYGGIPPFPETQNYVRRITAELAKLKASSKIGSRKQVQLGAIDASLSGLSGQRAPSDRAHNRTAGSTAAGTAAPSAAPALD
jgi:Transglycosylase SLT domain